MGVLVLADKQAVDKLAELGLTVEIIERVVRRADAEASMCTALDPPIMEGLTRWARTTRFLREELIPQGWRFDNPRSLPRTLHPSGEFAIVASTGDELTGLLDALPATKYPKGDATVRAVETNEQLTLDLGDFDLIEGDDAGEVLTWLLMYHASEDEFRVELSLPDEIVDGRITSWAVRIILPAFPHDEDRLAGPVAPAGDDSDDSFVVEVTRR